MPIMTNIKIWYVLMLAHCDNIATMSTMSTMATMQIPDTLLIVLYTILINLNKQCHTQEFW